MESPTPSKCGVIMRRIVGTTLEIAPIILAALAIVIIPFVVVTTISTFGPLVNENKKAREQNEYEYYHQRGYQAQKAGVPANANPNKAGNDSASAWLDGWMVANTEKK